MSQSNSDLKTTIGTYKFSVVPRSLMNIDGSLLSASSDKSKLLTHIIKYQVSNVQSFKVSADSIALIDAMLIVQCIDIKAWKVKTCEDIGNLFFNKITPLTKGFQKIHYVFDTYKEHSLKFATRERRRRGENAIKYNTIAIPLKLI